MYQNVITGDDLGETLASLNITKLVKDRIRGFNIDKILYKLDEQMGAYD